MTARRRWRRIVSVSLLTTAGALVVATWPSAANADPAVRTAWWNTASGGGQSAPAPTAPDGGLHVAVAPGQILAFGAVLYDLAPDATATLELKLSGQGTPALVACPTKDTSWKAGGDQPSDAAPAYDCASRSFTGSVSSDGATVTFLVDGGAETTPGELSLAILPYMTHDAPAGVGTQLPVDATQPFSVDIAKPDVSSLTVTSLPTVPTDTSGGTTQQPVSDPATAGSGTSTAGGTSAGGQVPPTLTAGGPPPGTGTVDAAPQVAAPTTPTTTGAVTPSAAGAPKLNNTAHNAALALLVLVAMAVISSGTTTMQRAPRLLGGAGRHAGAAAAAAVPVAMMAPVGVRGLGRFAKQRSAAPRPLV